MDNLEPVKYNLEVVKDQLEVVNPVAQVMIRKTSLARRLPSLDKRRVALYWNGKPGGDEALKYLGQLLQSKYTDLQVELIQSSTNGTKQKVEHAKTFDGVIGGCAD